jgi:hypothetical protein
VADARETAAAEVLQRVPAARRRLVRRLLAAPFERPTLVSLPTDHLITRAPIPRPARRRLLLTVTLQRWSAAARAALRRAASRVIHRLSRGRRGRR